ncbi:stage III sporulation protein AG [Peribacillus butanolivorans]|uniref:Stage III sporulation protein AG n=1 Tax=Peribacillus butanolivorans TaxID=421767 RepID=A0AAX0S3H4_9BACI|nr:MULTISPECIES: stage III sporulation protein AG [Peribacillus]KQU18385.1 stage III sporulation protein AG [Bacillus sp. Leaf13]KRF63356.1 stage III sporulation protein AG [Bacillus sp. Soil768D1]AXN37478.1 stage III sporulation protein AG [Peribacillus butanolivorans]KON70025.1 stage III sporulation protein AG [Peribacillus butanolivorans]MBK5442504.1 stage III sporulation protein AG [Peribacillus sp. TH24]
MNKDKGPLSWLQKLVNKDPDQKEPKEKKPSLYVYALIVVLLGAGIMMAGNLLTTNQTGQTSEVKTVFNNKQDDDGDVETFGQKNKSEFKTTKDYEIYLQNEMKEALESIAGVDDVKVVIYVDASEKKVYERNKVTQKQVTEETDQEGGKRTVEDTSVDEQLVLIKSGEKEGPIISETKKPSVRGVLVVAKGAENIQIKKWIIEAVTRSLDVPSHRVSVMPKK